MDKGLQIYKKPMLALITETKKLRNYPEPERLSIATKMIMDLNNDLGVSSKANPDHHIRAIKFIAETCGNYTPEEMTEAFKKFIAHEFKMEVYQQVNAVVVGRIIREWEFYKTEKLKIYNLKKQEIRMEAQRPTDEDTENIMIEACDRIYREYKSTRQITGAIPHIYKYLFEKNLLPNHNKEFKEAIKQRAIAIAKSEAYTAAGSDYLKHIKIKDTIAAIEAGTGGDIKGIAKHIIVADFIRELIKEGTNIIDLL